MKRDSICWDCERVLRECIKPVEGWVATEEDYMIGDSIEKSYCVISCPMFKRDSLRLKNKDIAKFLGISTRTFYRNKEKYLNLIQEKLPKGIKIY